MKFTEEFINERLGRNHMHFWEAVYNPDMIDEQYPEDPETAAEFKALGIELDDIRKELKQIHYHSEGSGNKCFVTYHVVNLDIYITLEGVYSSWEDTEWYEAYLSEPFVFSETRYKKI